MKTFGYVVEFHGHSCPGLALGDRVSSFCYRLEKLGGRAVDEESVAIIENNFCAVDAVQVTTGVPSQRPDDLFRSLRLP